MPINRFTGRYAFIRYGVISVNSVVQSWSDSSEPDMNCEECECYNKEDEECGEQFCECDSHDYILDDGEYKAFQSADDTDIFIILSPYYTYAQFCSPCAPGACHLNNPLDEEIENNKCYCFGEDWFDDEYPCEYPIYRVSDNECIYRPAKKG